MKKILTIVLFIVISFVLGASAHKYLFSFERLSLGQIQKQVIEQRDLGIKKAIAAGDYNCCVGPACTMCYMEDNIWNNQNAGTCACADLIGQGKEPCPQCERMLSEGKDVSCQLDQIGEVSCESN